MAKMTGKAKKTETFTTRLEPKDRYALELLSRVSKKSIAKTLEDAIQEQTEKAVINVPGRPERSTQLVEVLHILWQPREWQRIINLAGLAPSLLTYSEECKLSLVEMSKVICPKITRNDFGGIAQIEINSRLVEIAWPLIDELSEKMASGQPSPSPSLKDIEKFCGEKIEVDERDLVNMEFN